jgi:hypothetical protein
MIAPGERCARCPVGGLARCAGLNVRRYCELLDPAHKRHDARYSFVVVSESERIAGVPPPEPAPAGAALEPCCGGVAYPRP